jgi:hypothetical protein
LNFCFFSVVGGRDFFFSLMLFNGVGTRVVTVISCVWNLVTDEGTGRGNSAYVMHVAFLKITDLSSAAKWGYVTVENKAKKVKKNGKKVFACGTVRASVSRSLLAPCLPPVFLSRHLLVDRCDLF